MTAETPIDRRMYATKRIAVSKMYARLASTRALWWQAFWLRLPHHTYSLRLRLSEMLQLAALRRNAIFFFGLLI